ncbi:MAG: hypothetical protein ABIF77_04645 [bacterium]
MQPQTTTRATTLLIGVILVLVAVAGDTTAQTVTYSLQATADELDSGLHRFGFRDEATTGIDEYDLPEPPTSPTDYLGAAFRMIDSFPPLPNRWRHDIRDSQDFVDKLEIWELHLETDRIGATCTVALDIEAGAQFDLKLQVIGLGPSPITVPVPGQFSLALSKPVTTLWLELTSDEPIAGRSCSWGELKAEYR